MTTPSWLPEELSLEDNEQKDYPILYSVFTIDIKQHNLSFHKCPVWYDMKRHRGEVYEAGFIHLVTRECNTITKRIYDFFRSKKLNWLKPVIENIHCSTVLCWPMKNGKKNKRYYLWLKDFDYVIILEDRRHFRKKNFLLITAYHIDGSSAKRNLYKKFERREPII